MNSFRVFLRFRLTSRYRAFDGSRLTMHRGAPRTEAATQGGLDDPRISGAPTRGPSSRLLRRAQPTGSPDPVDLHRPEAPGKSPPSAEAGGYRPKPEPIHDSVYDAAPVVRCLAALAPLAHPRHCSDRRLECRDGWRGVRRQRDRVACHDEGVGRRAPCRRTKKRPAGGLCGASLAACRARGAPRACPRDGSGLA